MEVTLKKKQTPKRDPEPLLEDLRDDCVAIFLNSGMTQQQVHEAGGPTPQTISKWLYKETRFPQLPSVRALLKACGGDLVAVSAKRADWLRGALSDEERLGVTLEVKPTMPPKRHVVRREARKASARRKAK